MAAAAAAAAAAVTAKPIVSVKALAESSAWATTPSNYSYSNNLNHETSALDLESVPIIDFSLLTSGNPDQRSKVIEQLGKACEEWGFFLLINHGVPESLMKAVVDCCDEFFNLPMEEKQEYAKKDVWEPVRFGSGVDVKVGRGFLWRDFLKLFAHPHSQFPTKPPGLSAVVKEYCTRSREVVLELLKGISETLGLEQNYIEKAMDMESGLQVFAANLYPCCPHPELAMGIPAHCDHGLLTLLIQNGIGGLQIQHNGEWFDVEPLPNSFVVNTSDQLEILTNGKYKSVMHRAVVNNKATRMSIPIANGPALDKVVSPAPELVEREGRPPAFKPMKYKDYMELQQASRTDEARIVDQIRTDIV